MPLYEMTTDEFRTISSASFTSMGVRERGDIQRLLKTQIDVLGEDLYVVAEEFGEWEDSRRRVDLLAVDREANLVVIELKRTQDGGHMEQQAIRYAAMVSAMTFEGVVRVHGDYLAANGQNREEAEDRLLAFLGWDEAEEESFANDVRILLVSEDFGKELTTAVLWLRDRDIDIRCIRLRPYQDGERMLVDVQPIIPLPEIHQYQVQLREKEQIGRRNRCERDDLRLQFWEGVVALAHRRGTRHASITPGIYHWIGASAGYRGLGFNYTVGKDYAVVELYIDRGVKEENKRIFDALHADKEAIEAEFGGELSWERLDDKRACRVKAHLTAGGYRNPVEEWPLIHKEMVDKMDRLEGTLGARLGGLGL